MEQGPRTLQSLNLKTPQDDKVTSSYSAGRRAKKLTTPTSQRQHHRIDILLILAAGNLVAH
jgi:hypothetical protein